MDKTQFDKILSYINCGVEEGAVLEAGGGRQGDRGFFVQPTVFSGVTDTMKIAKEEIFGPVQSILKFTDLEEVTQEESMTCQDHLQAIQRANNTPYGLAAGILTKDLQTALQFSQRVQAGSVWVNCYDHTVAHVSQGGGS